MPGPVPTLVEAQVLFIPHRSADSGKVRRHDVNPRPFRASGVVDIAVLRL
jgi:hypothetical protein